MIKQLYKISKRDTVDFWQISVIDNVITVVWGKENGKQQTKTEVVLNGKNIGKSNETTATEQAVLEAESKVRSQRDKGYCDSIEEAIEYKNNTIKPMLAENYLDPVQAQKMNWSNGVIVQPNMD